MYRVVCSHCGTPFIVDKHEAFFSPEKCPGCNFEIIMLEVPDDGSRVVAIVEA